MAVSIYTVRVVLQTLGVVDYGVYHVIGGVVASLSFLSDVLANASQRFFAVELGRRDTDRLNQIFGLVTLVYFVTSIIIIIIAETVGLWFVLNKMDVPSDRMDAALFVYQFSILSFVFQLITNPFQAIIIARERMNIYAYMSIFQVLLKLGIVYLLVISPYDKLKFYALLMFLSVIISNGIIVYWCRRNFAETKIRFKWDKGIFKSIFSYSSWTLIGSLAFIFNTQGLNILFNLFFGPVANAAYAIGNSVKASVNSFAANFFVATRPPMIKSYAEGNNDYTLKLFYFSSKVIFSLLFVLIVPIFAEIDFILDLWLDTVEQYMPGFVRLMLVWAVILSMSEPITAISQAAGKVKIYHGIVDTFTLLTLPLSYIAFYFNLSAYYGFLISIAVFIVAHIIRLYILRSFFILSISHYCKVIVCPIIATMVLTFIAVRLSQFFLGNSIAIIVVSFVLSTALVWLIIFDKGERESVINIISSKFKRK